MENMKFFELYKNAIWHIKMCGMQLKQYLEANL